MTDSNVKSKISDETRTQIVAIAATATPEERRKVADLVAKTKDASYGSSIVEVTPAMAAIVFVEDNPHNRDWNPAWTLELARRMRSGIWQQNNQTPGFYTTGQLADGQHRFAAVALAGITWKTVVIAGILPSAIVTVDAGKRRHASDAAKLEGIANTKMKETIIKMTSSYMTKLGDKSAALPSETEVANAIKDNNKQLELAIEVAHASAQNLVTPILKPTVAATIAHLMMQHGWPEMRVREKLALLNSGQSSGGESEPFFVAGEWITKARTKADTKERLTTVKEVGLVILVMEMTERGVTAVRKKALEGELRKSLPDPAYRPQAIAA